MALSQRTLKIKRNKRLLTIVSIILTILPIMLALILGFMKASHSGRYALTLTSIVSLLILIIEFSTKHKLQDIIICLIIVVFYYTCSKAIPIIIVYVACSMLDRLIITPLHDHLAMKYISAKEIDQHNE